MTEQPGKEQWLPLSEAAKRLGVNHSKLSKLVKRGTIQSKNDPLDMRVTLVNMTELQALFAKDRNTESD